MPELPEIVHFKTFIEGTILEKEITAVDFPETKLLQAPESEFKDALLKNKFINTRQLGKYLLLETNGEKWLAFHFGMTGKFEFYNHHDHPKHSQIIISFKDASNLAFVCPRKLGKIYLTEGVAQFREENALGEDALELNLEDFFELLQDKRGSIKTALTDQHLISGIGNVYADEILYQCKIHPKTKLEKLSEKERKEVFEETNAVLKTAIKNEGKRSDLPSNYITPHRKKGVNCLNCSGKIEMIKVSGRSTYFCPDCQKEKE